MQTEQDKQTIQSNLVGNLRSNLAALSQRIEAACRAARRDPATVTLIGVTKTKPGDAVTAAANLGVHHFGENYLAEALGKIKQCQDLEVTWHYIGRIQSNKTRLIAEHFDWVHTVDRDKIAQRLNDQCPPGKKLNVLMQINIDADPAKAGLQPAEAAKLLDNLVTQPNLVPRGLMTILARSNDSDATSRAEPGASYQSMAQLFNQLREKLTDAQQENWDTLSMGMTADLEPAIKAGATAIRIGTALFGERTGERTGERSGL